MVINAIMRKMLKLSNSARKHFTMGQITNLVSVDAQRLLEATPYLCILWSAPYQVSIHTINDQDLWGISTNVNNLFKLFATQPFTNSSLTSDKQINKNKTSYKRTEVRGDFNIHGTKYF